jgi:CMP-N-acetylneuraminic acid synthetase
VQATCIHALESVEARSSFRADAIVVLYGNVPVRPVNVIDRAIDKLIETRCDSVRSLTPVGKWHPAWMHRLSNDTMQPLHGGSIHRRQDLEPVYLHDGAAIAVTRESMLRGKVAPEDPHAFFGVELRGIVSDMDQTVEIDHQRDLYWAEAVLRERGAGMELRRLAS